MAIVRLIVVQGPLQLLNVLSVLRYQAEVREYQTCDDYLIMGGYRRDEQLDQTILDISQSWNFKARHVLHDFIDSFYEGKFDFAAAVGMLKDLIHLKSADVLYVSHNWKFINEILLTTYSDARKICFGDSLGWLELEDPNSDSTESFNPSGLSLIDDAYLITPFDSNYGFNLCQLHYVPATFFQQVVIEAAHRINGLQNYCAVLREQLGPAITIVTPTYETLAGFIEKVEQEVMCNISCLQSFTQPNERLLIKPHPREIFQETQLLLQGLSEIGRSSVLIRDEFKYIPIELFGVYLPFQKAVTFGSSCCVSLAYLYRCELVIGYGEPLVRQFFKDPLQQANRLLYEYVLSLFSNQAYGGSFTALQIADIQQSITNYHQQSIALQPYSLIEQSFPHEIQEQDVVKWFHQLYYHSAQHRGATWKKTYWMGQSLYKCPLDLWIYQEILFRIKPELIIECGTLYGGSALFFAQMCDLLGQGEIITIDIDPKPNRPQHPRITYWQGSSISEEIFERVRQKAAGKSPILVILDSDHRAPHVLDELRLYSRFVTPGSYIIVEDSNVHGHPVYLEHGPGPMEALQSFLKENSDFYIDRECEKFYLTMNPSGYLRRRSLNRTEGILSQLKHDLTQYQHEWVAAEALAKLQQTRQQIASVWLALDPQDLELEYTGNLGEAHRTLLKSGIQDEPLQEAEQQLLEQIMTGLAAGITTPESLRYLLAGMLYRRADQLQIPYNLSAIPGWLMSDYIYYLFHAHSFFRGLGEATDYYQYLKGWIDYFHASALQSPESPFWQETLKYFLLQENFIPLYFNQENLQEIYCKRADLLESCLQQFYQQPLDYDFSGPSYRKKIRLGILASHYLPSAETFAALPIYEYLSREFEVVLYSLRETGHPLEQYCRSCASAFRLLPQENVEAQVQMIRSDDLDLMFVVGNVTAVTSPLCLLSLYRLARKQITSIGSIVTTGLRHMDYFLSGHLSDPSLTAQEHYREKLVKLAGSAHCFSYGVESFYQPKPQVSRQALGIAETTPVYISTANFFKLIPELLQTWAKILAAVPGSVLILLPFGPNWSSNYPKQPFTDHVLQIFASYGVAAERVMILDPNPVLDREGVKEYCKLADIYLDSHPVAGTTSLIEPLQVGLPTITGHGDYLRSSMAGALVQTLGLPELVGRDEAEYISLAVALGQDVDLRNQRRAEVEQAMATVPPFLDSRSYADRIGALFAEIHTGHLQESLKLQQWNLLLFPDWRASEEALVTALAEALRSVLLHPEADRITVLIDGSFVPDVEEADMLISSIVLELLMEMEIESRPEISLLSQFGEAQWHALLPFVQARIPLAAEDTLALDRAGARHIPTW